MRNLLLSMLEARNEEIIEIGHLHAHPELS